MAAKRFGVLLLWGAVLALGGAAWVTDGFKSVPDFGRLSDWIRHGQLRAASGPVVVQELAAGGTVQAAVRVQAAAELPPAP